MIEQIEKAHLKSLRHRVQKCHQISLNKSNTETSYKSKQFHGVRENKEIFSNLYKVNWAIDKMESALVKKRIGYMPNQATINILQLRMERTNSINKRRDSGNIQRLQRCEARQKGIPKKSKTNLGKYFHKIEYVLSK